MNTCSNIETYNFVIRSSTKGEKKKIVTNQGVARKLYGITFGRTNNKMKLS